MNCYVTLFDSNYLTRGLVLYRSLMRHAQPFHLWMICFDDLAYSLLQQLALEHVTLITLSAFEDAELLRIKAQRTWQEYCWTATPSTLLYVFETQPEVDVLTYLDADLMFFASPHPLFAEMQTASILLTEHRYVPQFAHFMVHGRFNVQYLTFRRNHEAFQALHWWRERCLEWCFNRLEDQKFGDQKYLDDWPTRFAGVHVLQHIGGGVAPWNVGQYRLTHQHDRLYVDNIPLIFYHFHNFKFYQQHLSYVFRDYPVTANVKRLIYSAYMQEMVRAYRDVRQIAPKFNAGREHFPTLPGQPQALLRFLRGLLYEIRKGRYYYHV